MEIKEKIAKTREEIRKLGYSNRKVSVRGDWNKMWVTIKSLDAIKELKKIEEIAQKAEVVFIDDSTGEILAGGNFFVEVEVEHGLEQKIIEMIKEKIDGRGSRFSIAGLNVSVLDEGVTIRSKYTVQSYRFADTATAITRYCITYCPQQIEAILAEEA